MDSSSSSQTSNVAPEVKLLEVPITDENTALNVMVSFLNLAQRRGAFAFAESAKIYECIQKFIQQSSASESSESTSSSSA